MIILNIQLVYRRSKDIFKASPLVCCPGAMVNPQWLELPMCRKHYMVLKMFEPVKCIQVPNGPLLYYLHFYKLY